MSEEKDLSEAFEDNDELLSDFVDFADLEDLDGMDNSALFGELGDIADLGDLLEAMPTAADGTMESEESVSVPEEAGEIADLDSLLAGLDVADAPQEEDTGDVSLDALIEDEEIPPLDAFEEELSVDELSEEEETLALDAISEGEEEALSADAFIEDSAEVPSLDALIEEDGGETLSLDSLMDDSSEDALLGESADATLDIDSIFDESEEGVSIDDLSVGMDAIADGAAPLPDGMSLTESADELVADASPESSILDGLDLGFSMADSSDDMAVAEEESSGMDSMLDGLLGDLDMNGTLDETLSANEEESAGDPLADLLGLDDSSLGDSDSDLDDLSRSMLGVENMVPEQEEEPKPGFFKRIFGNIITDEIAQQEKEAAQKAEEEAALKQEEDAKAQEEKEALKAEKAEEKAAKKEEQRKLKEAKKAEKAAKKAEKKAEREAEEAAELEVVGKLNKVGVSIIVIATVIFLVIEIAGTNAFGYISARNKAVDYFDMGKYTEAYQEAVGTDMREKDKDDYNKIKVVMKVQQCLNAYQNYDRIKYYPEALDALLRGIKRYDTYIEEATALEVEKDMMSCRKQILTILQSEFAMTETQAYEILALDKEAYTDRVVEIGINSK